MSLFLIRGEDRAVSRGRAGRWLRQFAHPLGGVVGRKPAQYPASSLYLYSLPFYHILKSKKHIEVLLST